MYRCCYTFSTGRTSKIMGFWSIYLTFPSDLIRLGFIWSKRWIYTRPVRCIASICLTVSGWAVSLFWESWFAVESMTGTKSLWDNVQCRQERGASLPVVIDTPQTAQHLAALVCHHCHICGRGQWLQSIAPLLSPHVAMFYPEDILSIVIDLDW